MCIGLFINEQSFKQPDLEELSEFQLMMINSLLYNGPATKASAHKEICESLIDRKILLEHTHNGYKYVFINPHVLTHHPNKGLFRSFKLYSFPSDERNIYLVDQEYMLCRALESFNRHWEENSPVVIVVA